MRFIRLQRQLQLCVMHFVKNGKYQADPKTTWRNCAKTKQQEDQLIYKYDIEGKCTKTR